MCQGDIQEAHVGTASSKAHNFWLVPSLLCIATGSARTMRRAGLGSVTLYRELGRYNFHTVSDDVEFLRIDEGIASARI